jgi:hypothetical protein
VNVTPRPKTTRRRKPSTDKEAATRLHSKIVRARGVCEYAAAYTGLAPDCDGPLQCAHIIRRRYARTQTDLNNALCLCAKHHAWLDLHLADFIHWVGEDRYRELQHKADAGIQATGLSTLMFWRGERARLTDIAKGMGL